MGARDAGSSHVALDLPCQDRFACAVPRRDWFVAAVVDGAGSASLADRGAEEAVTAVVRSVELASTRTDFEPRSALAAATAEARASVLRLAEEEGVEGRDVACTLLSVVLSPAGGAALQIGDGLIAVTDESEEWSWVFWPQRGEYANTTRFLTDEDAEDRWMLDELPATVTDVALVSDGLEPLALHYASLSAHGPFFDAFLGPLVRSRAEGQDGEDSRLSTELARFLISERVTERTHDDVCLVLATRRPPPHPSR